MTKADFNRIVDTRRSNGLLQLRVPTIQTKFRFFKDELSLSDEDIRKLLVKCPRVMEHKIESTMRPHLEFLQQQGVAKEDLGKVNPSCNCCALTCLTQQLTYQHLLHHACFAYALLSQAFPPCLQAPLFSNFLIAQASEFHCSASIFGCYSDCHDLAASDMAHPKAAAWHLCTIQHNAGLMP